LSQLFHFSVTQASPHYSFKHVTAWKKAVQDWALTVSKLNQSRATLLISTARKTVAKSIFLQSSVLAHLTPLLLF